MSAMTDILLRSPDGRAVAAIEVKSRRGLTPEIATQMRRNMLAHGLLPQADFLLLLTQDVGYLWDKSAFASTDSSPRLGFSMAPVIDRYAPRDLRDSIFREPELTLLAMAWLADLTFADDDIDSDPESDLAKLGFLAAIRGADMLTEAARDRVR